MTSPSATLAQVTIASTGLHRLDAQSVLNQSYEVRVWLPPSYPDSPDKHYPILYMSDGDQCFGMAVDVVRYLIRGKLVPELIVAAVGYGSDRPPEEGGLNMRSRDLAPFVTDFSPQPGGEAFRQFLEQELVPFIESTYRVDPDLRAFYGFSLGGLFGLYVMLKSPDLFRRQIIISPALMPSTAQIVDQAELFIASEASHPLSLYMCVGELELFVPLFTRLADVFEKGTQAGLRFEWEVFPRGVHMTAPAQGLATGIRMAFGSRSIYEAMCKAYNEEGIASAKALYQELRAREDREYNLAEEELNSLGYMLLYRGKVDDAIEVFELNVMAYPQAWNAYDSLAEAYLASGNISLARGNYERSIQLNPKNEAGIAQLKKLHSGPELPTPAKL